MSKNLLKNGGFEADWGEERSHRCLVFPADGNPQEKDVGNIFTPSNWLTWFRHEPGTWDQPEARDAWKSNDPRRVHDGEKGMLLFTFHRKHDAGFIQQVEVPGHGTVTAFLRSKTLWAFKHNDAYWDDAKLTLEGNMLRLTAWAHAWSNHPIEGHAACAEDGRCSAGVGRGGVFLLEKDVPPLSGDPWSDAIGNFSFAIGIDPTGGTDPFADTVQWGERACIYNEHAQVPEVVLVLEEPPEPPNPPPDPPSPPPEPPAPPQPPEPPPAPRRGDPRCQYERTYVLAHPSADESFMLKLLDLSWGIGERWTVGGSADDAGIGNLDVRRVIALRPGEWGGDLQAFFEQHYPGVVYWPLDWEDDYQLKGRLLAYSLREAGLALAYPTAHGRGSASRGGEAVPRPHITDIFGRWRPESGVHHCGLDLASSWSVWGDEILSATDGVVVEAGWHGNQGNFGYRVRVRTIAPDGREVLIRYAHLTGDDGIYVRTGDGVVTGQKLGRPDSSGKSTPERSSGGDHLHIDVRVGDTYADPALLIQWPENAAKAVAEAAAGVIAHPLAGSEAVLHRKVHCDTQSDLQLSRPEPAGGCRQSAEYSSSAKVADGVPPRWPYRRTYVLLPQIEDTVERLEWRVAAAIGSSEQMRTVGHSADDAGVGPLVREIVAVNPGEWRDELEAWYDEHYPNAEYRAVETESPWEMAINLLPPLDGDIALAQTDPQWADHDFGEDPDANGETIGRYGCFLTGLAIILRKVYGRDVTPPMLDRLLVAARAAYVSDNLLMWTEVVPLFPAFDESIKDNVQRSARQLEGLLSDGWEIILRRADGGHFVYLEAVEGDVLHIIDTWDGERKEKAAPDYIGVRAARVRERQPSPESTESAKALDWVPPRIPYRRTYVLLPQIEDSLERIEWRIAAAIGSSEQMRTVGHSADDAGVGPLVREIVAVNPGEWDGDLRAWYDEHYPNAKYRTVETESPWEMAVRLLPLLNEDIALAQTDRRWAGYDFGEEPDENGETIGRYGCFLTGLAIILRKLYQRDITPPMLDKLLVTARAGYFNDNLMNWHGVVPLFPAFDDGIKDNVRRSAVELKRLLRNGWEIILRQADGSHFVYLEDVKGDVLHIIDTWDGKRKQKSASAYAGIRAAHLKPQGPPLPLPKVLVGLHDQSGGEWMAGQGLRGCCLVHRMVQRQPIQIDCRRLQETGITVIGRLNWGYADGTGTLPRPEHKNAFVDAVVQTMLAARGVDYFHVGNEPNNRSEWPGFKTGNEYALTPDYVTEIYNEIWHRVAGRVKLGPPPLDPYFGPNSNNREWWVYMLDNVAGADALFLHAKTQTNDPAEARARDRFGDWPLTWQYLHLKTVETALAIVPDRFRTLPVFITELNPQFLETGGGATGWLADNDEWVREALGYFREERPVNGVVFYRYEPAGDQAPFGLEHKPAILDAIKEETMV
jgi:murein DD-endopeptidase MepM/ murein hydrolase activator NlpD